MAGPEEAYRNVFEESQRSKITIGNKGDHYCFVLMAFSNLVALKFISPFQKEVRYIGQEP